MAGLRVLTQPKKGTLKARPPPDLLEQSGGLFSAGDSNIKGKAILHRCLKLQLADHHSFRAAFSVLILIGIREKQLNNMTQMLEVDEKMLSEIRHSVQDTADRGLKVASRWSAEMLLSLPSSLRDAMKDAWKPDPTMSTANATPFDALEGKLDINRTLEVEEMDEIESARRCMESRDYLRAAYYAKRCRSAQGVFLYVYSRFLVSEQSAVAEWHRSDGTAQCTRFQPPLPVNPSIGELLEIIESTQDPFLKFLKALFCKRLSRTEDAINTLIESLSSYPWNWSAWILLESCVDSRQDLMKAISRLSLPPNHPLPSMLIVKTANDLYGSSAADLKLCDALLNRFPNSVWLMTQRARTLYIHAAFSKAEAQFEQILKLDPNRIDDIDFYGNILYTTQKREKLSALADRFTEKDRDRPEVCCVLGNVCSMRLEHEKAIKYFKRATRLDPMYLQGWTNLGLELMEVTNPPAAIEAFRRAIGVSAPSIPRYDPQQKTDISKKDYRPWYGIAQAYVALNLPLYALYYFSKAGALR
ncbi:Anaphase-promoting complex subunit 8 [Marasmius sp. AFHP31]|nr:Anaphase-promoting complex subunit 8 [Marasmius sp. AFHP31]